MLGAARLEVGLAHRPAGAARARRVHLSLAAARQTRHDCAVLGALRAPVTGRRPHGRLQADDAGAHDVHAGRPHGAVAVHPYLAGVRAGARHAGEQGAPDGEWFARGGGVRVLVWGSRCRGGGAVPGRKLRLLLVLVGIVGSVQSFPLLFRLGIGKVLLVH